MGINYMRSLMRNFLYFTDKINTLKCVLGNICLCRAEIFTFWRIECGLLRENSGEIECAFLRF